MRPSLDSFTTIISPTDLHQGTAKLSLFLRLNHTMLWGCYAHLCTPHTAAVHSSETSVLQVPKKGKKGIKCRQQRMPCDAVRCCLGCKGNKKFCDAARSCLGCKGNTNPCDAARCCLGCKGNTKPCDAVRCCLGCKGNKQQSCMRSMHDHGHSACMALPRYIAMSQTMPRLT